MTSERLFVFATEENGGVIVDWTTLAGAVVGLGIASVAAVQTGVVSLGGKSGDSLAVTTAAYTDQIASGGPDVQMNTGKDVYTPIKTNKELFASYVYELAGKSKEELSELYLKYLDEAVAYLERGDLDAAAANLDVAGAVAEVMKDYRYSLPKSDYKLQDFYGKLSVHAEKMGTLPSQQDQASGKR